MTSAPKILEKTFRDILESHLGKQFTVVNPDSFGETAVGHQIKPNWYEGRLAALGEDFVVVVLRFHHGGGKNSTTEPVDQYVPLSQIKRISVMKQKRFIHL